MFKGKRTYVAAALIALVAVLQYGGVIDTDTATVLYGLLGAGGIAAMRAAIH